MPTKVKAHPRKGTRGVREHLRGIHFQGWEMLPYKEYMQEARRNLRDPYILTLAHAPEITIPRDPLWDSLEERVRRAEAHQRAFERWRRAQNKNAVPEPTMPPWIPRRRSYAWEVK